MSAHSFREAAEESGRKNIEAPILNHPQFETLEAEGMAKHGRKIARAVEVVKRVVG